MEWTKYFDATDCKNLKNRLRVGMAAVISLAIVVLVIHINNSNPVVLTLGYLMMFATMGYVTYMIFSSDCNFQV